MNMSTTGTGRRVLSIQSHVVSGYVGNKSATFPLQVGNEHLRLNVSWHQHIVNKSQT